MSKRSTALSQCPRREQEICHSGTATTPKGGMIVGTAPSSHGSLVNVISRDQLRDCRHWQSAFASQHKDHRYYEIVEDTVHPEFDYWYFAIRDHQGEIQAIQPFFVLDQRSRRSTRITAITKSSRIPSILNLTIGILPSGTIKARFRQSSHFSSSIRDRVAAQGSPLLRNRRGYRPS